MKKTLPHLFVCLTLIAGSRAIAQNRIAIEANRPATRVSKTLYGLFFEEINHAGDGGLYAEMLRNGSFEESNPMAGWNLTFWQGSIMSLTLKNAPPLRPAKKPDIFYEQCESSIDSEEPVAKSNPRYLLLRFPGEAMAKLENDGYWGISIKKGEKYRLSFFMKNTYGVELFPSLQVNGKIASTVDRGGEGGFAGEGDWNKQTFRLTATRDASNAKLSIAFGFAFRSGFGSRDRLCLDNISLFPEETWKKRPNGLRRDLAEKLDALRPAFIRFPGGCFVEGFNIKEAFRWKKTIGALETRPTHGNKNWDYHSSDGLGYHEYLQMCEDMKAEPLFVINCGMSCAFRSGEIVPMENLGEWVQDALDAVEYANGDITTKWGAIRALNGHPKPFNLRYMEIGNENGWGDTFPRYEERYARFHDALKAKYPEVTLIATTPVKVRPMDMVDEHFYNSPQWFFDNANRYDSYSRNGAKVYVGEYAVTTGCGQGNLIAGLAEAAWMMGMERNSDIVRMASYAPLFVNVNDRKWNPDAIGYDNANSYGTPSYYVQKLFGRNLPDVNLPTRATAEVKPAPVQTGTIGLGTWRTQAEYKDLSLSLQNGESHKLNFRDHWEVFKGDWKVEGEAYRQTRLEDDQRAVLAIPALRQEANYTLRVKARKLAGAEGFLVMFRVKSDGEWYWWNIGGWGNTQHAIERSKAGGKSLVGAPVRGSIETGRWYDVRIELSGARIRCYLDDKLIHEVEEREGARLFAQAGRASKSGEIIVKVVNGTNETKTTEISIEGVTQVNPKAETWTLSGDPDAENSLKEPHKVIPIKKTLSNAAPRFQYVFPPFSLTVFRFKAQ